MKYIKGLLLILLIIGCSKIERIDPENFEIKIEKDSVVFAQIGDFGSAGLPEYEVAEMVKIWNPEFIISVGDNNYSDGEYQSLKANISSYYGDFIYNYDAPKMYQCLGKAFEDKTNRFFPTPGNHDGYSRDKLTPYFNYFTLPGNESYYSFQWGPVTFYSLNSIYEDINREKSWLNEEVKKCQTPFRIAFFHHPPYSTGDHGDNAFMQWNFSELGIDVVFSGHDHIYNRIEKDDEKGLIYIVNGLGGKSNLSSLKHFAHSGEFHIFNYNKDFGAIRSTATKSTLTLEFYSIHTNDPIDKIVIAN
jgi:hypothetical protein